MKRNQNRQRPSAPGSVNIASPQSTGGEGNVFENNVQSLFAVLMLCDGEIPIFPNQRIVSIAMQTSAKGCSLDDILVEFENKDGERFRLLGQIKKTLSLTPSDNDFKETLQAAWNDFLHHESSTEFALITGPLSQIDNGKIDWLSNRVRTRPASEFEEEMASGLAISIKNRKFYRKICKILTDLNGIEPDASQLHEFLSKFHVMQPDIWSPGGMVESFALSLLKRQFGEHAPAEIWAVIKNIVERYNSAGGTIDRLRLLTQIQEQLGMGTQALPNTDVRPNKEIAAQIKSHLARLPQHSPSLRPDRLALLSLVGSWNLQARDDRHVLCRVLDMDEGTLDDFLHEIACHVPGVLRMEGGWAFLEHRQSLWQATANALSHRNIERFLATAQEKLSMLDRRLESPPETLWMRSSEDAGFGISTQLREGLAHGLALLGAGPRHCTQVDLSTRENWTRRVVRKCLSGADWRTWASLDGLLPFLAEAAPEEYIACTRTFMARRKDGLKTLLQEHPGIIVPVSHSIGFLKALGLLAWIPACFASAVELLCEIVSKDKSGQHEPRAATILQAVLQPGDPHTVVESSRRVKIFRSLVERQFKDRLWNVVLGLLPCGPRVLPNGANPPLYRKVGEKTPPGEALDRKDVQKQIDEYTLLAISLCGANADRLSALVERLAYFNLASFMAFVTHAKKHAPKIRGEDRYRIWKKLHRRCQHIAMLPERKAVFPASDGERKLQDLTCLYEPTEPQFRYRSLFDYGRGDFVSGTPSVEQEARLKELWARRTAAVLEIYKQTGISGVLDFAGHVEKSGDVGFLLGQHSAPEADHELLPRNLDIEDDKRRWAVSGFVSGRFEAGGWSWVSSVLDEGWSHEQKAALLAILPFGHDVWRRLPDLLGADVALYWRKNRTHWLNQIEDITDAIEGLLSAGCGYSAVDLLDQVKTLHQFWNADLCEKVLDAFVEGKVTDSPLTGTGHQLSEIFKQLQNEPNFPEPKMARYEWFFFEVFDQFGEFSQNKIHPIALERLLASDPGFFCKALTTAFLPAKTAAKRKERRKQRSLAPDEEVRAKHVWSLLHNWSVIPGVGIDGKFDGKKFASWVKKAFSQARKLDRLLVAQSILGQAIYRGAPKADDGFWMPHEIALFMEKRGNEKMRNAYGIAVSNSRGVYFQDPTLKADRDLADKYNKQAEEAEERGYVGLAQVMRRAADFVMEHALRSKERRELEKAHFDAQRERE